MTYNTTMYNLGLQQVRLNKAQLDATNAIYADGQLIIETDTNTYTTGDGTSNYRTIRGNTELNADERRSADDVLAANESPKIYAALMSQSGSAAPEAIVLNNTLGGTVVWTRTGGGIYRGTLAGAFPEDQCIIRCRPNKDNSTSFEFYAQWENENYIAFYSDGGDDVDMSNIWLEILVF